ncbi:MAG: hypothetical protein ACR2G0_09545, partial [Chthoniobacterales bacterium]
AFIVLAAIYVLFGLPGWLCRLTALQFVTPPRALLALGLAGFLLAFSSLRSDGRPLLAGRVAVLGGLAVTIGAIGYFFGCCRRKSPS